jgi:hypothetical protein
MSSRLGLALGLGVTVAVGTWWLGATRIAIEQTADAAAISEQALFVLAVVRAAVIVLLGTRTGAAAGFNAGVRTSLPVVAAAWPLVTLAWAASRADTMQVLFVEAVLVLIAVVVPALGHASGRLLRPAAAS